MEVVDEELLPEESCVDPNFIVTQSFSVTKIAGGRFTLDSEAAEAAGSDFCSRTFPRTARTLTDGIPGDCARTIALQGS